jgi:porphobilinogen synthase
MRRTDALRALVRETHIQPSDFIYPIFVREGQTEPEPISSMPGQSRLPVSHLADEAKRIQDLGIGAILIFGLPIHKDEQASSSSDPDGVVQNAIRTIKSSTPNLVVMTDVCVCAYMPHGHCGVLNGQEVDNDATLPLLANMAVSHAAAGADVVGPSSMMDMQVGALRTAPIKTDSKTPPSWRTRPSSVPHFMAHSEKPPTPPRALATAPVTNTTTPTLVTHDVNC